MSAASMGGTKRKRIRITPGKISREEFDVQLPDFKRGKKVHELDDTTLPDLQISSEKAPNGTYQDACGESSLSEITEQERTNQSEKTYAILSSTDESDDCGPAYVELVMSPLRGICTKEEEEQAGNKEEILASPSLSKFSDDSFSSQTDSSRRSQSFSELPTHEQRCDDDSCHMGENDHFNLHDQTQTGINSEEVKFKITLSTEEWVNIQPLDTGCQRKLEGDWTEVLYNKIREIYPGCVLSFKYNRVKRKNSRKRTAPFFLGRAECVGSSCSAVFLFTMKEEPPEENNNITIECVLSGVVTHTSTEKNTRQLTGNRRQSAAEECRKHGAINYYYTTVSSAPKRELHEGNTSQVPTPAVLRKAVSEMIHKELLHRDLVQELVLLKEAFYEEDDCEKNVRGYIQYIAVDPFTTILFSYDQIKLLRKLSSENALNLYIDATGSVIAPVKKQKRALLYSVVINDLEDVPPVSLADLITTDHTIPSLVHFFLRIKRAVLQLGNTFNVLKVETDFSWALIQSVLEAFGGQNVKEYLQKTWSVVHKKCTAQQLEKLTVLHLCAAHMIKTFAGRLAKLSMQKEMKLFAMNCFCLLQNSVTIRDAASIFQNMCCVMKSPVVNQRVAEALTHLEDLFNQDENATTSVFPEYEGDGNDPITKVVDEEIDTSLQEKTIREVSPYTLVFTSIMESQDDEDTEGEENTYHSKQIPQLLVKVFLPLFPLWSGIMLQPTEFYVKGSSQTITQTKSKKIRRRDTNAAVEGWFKALKIDTLQKQTRRKVGSLVCTLNGTIKSRLKERRYPVVRKPRKRKERKSLLLSTEKWQRKISRRARFYPHIYKPLLFRSKLTTQDVPGVKTVVEKVKSKQTARKSTTKSSVSVSEERPCHYQDENASTGSSHEDNHSNQPNKRRECESSLEGEVEGPIERNLYPRVPKWGGTADGVKLLNTCTVDNCLTIIYISYLENMAFKHHLEQHSGQHLLVLLLQCCKMMERGQFSEAKSSWITGTGKSSHERYIDAYGSEWDLFCRHIAKLTLSSLLSVCSNHQCPRQKKERHSCPGIPLSARTVSQEDPRWSCLLDNFLKPTTMRCGIPFKDTTVDKSSGAFLETWVDDGVGDALGKTKVPHHCAGIRSETRTVTQLAPILVLTVGDLVQANLIPGDIMAYPTETLNIHGRRFRLAGATMHTRSHFVGLVNSSKHGWLFYDGLEGNLIPAKARRFEHCTLVHVLLHED